MYPINTVGGSIVESAEPSIQHSMRFGRQDYALHDPLQCTIWKSLHYCYPCAPIDALALAGC